MAKTQSPQPRAVPSGCTAEALPPLLTALSPQQSAAVLLMLTTALLPQQPVAVLLRHFTPELVQSNEEPSIKTKQGEAAVAQHMHMLGETVVARMCTPGGILADTDMFDRLQIRFLPSETELMDAQQHLTLGTVDEVLGISSLSNISANMDMRPINCKPVQSHSMPPPWPPPARAFVHLSGSGVQHAQLWSLLISTCSTTLWLMKRGDICHRMVTIDLMAASSGKSEVLQEGRVPNQTSDTMWALAAAKVDGTRRLHNRSRTGSMVCKVLFSSVVSLLQQQREAAQRPW
ncbi:hypothetical protein CYMTET_8505 [Cymbomonas tetramitiformis]|uniref:Ketoreductase (KR) domain-containing protein n=1 Tax=Cymbomonas tetramitiformis TaxID=36881 RepID=A0AAE0LFS3_9CHLO|nr:hypothetical protein CYMTET_8505 [Cymbomonas tetramitiformis]